MTFTLTASAEPSHSPPRVLLTATEDDPAFVISSCVLFRNGVALRFSPTLTGASAFVYDTDAPFDTALTYRADAIESGILTAWAESWANTSAWTAGGGGAGWSVAAGVASAAADGSTIYRDLGGSLASLLVTTPTNVTVEFLNAAATVIASIRVSPDGNVTVSAGTTSSVAGTGTFTATITDTSLVVAGTGWSTSVSLTDVPTRVRLVAPTTPSLVKQFGAQGSTDGKFDVPSAVAVDGSGNIWVADSGNNRIEKFNSSGTWLLSVGKTDHTTGTGNGEFNFPRGITVDSSNNVYVADTNNHRIQKFNSSGTWQLNVGSSGSGDGQLASPRGVAVDASGNIFVADTSNNRVQKFNSSGTYVSKFGTLGTGNGQFDSPQGIALDSSANIFVGDGNNHRVQKFNSSGTYQLQFGTSGSGPGELGFQLALKVDASGNIYVADVRNDRVQKFNSSGVYVSKFGAFDLPAGIAIDSSGFIYVADTYNYRIQKFTPAGSTVDDITAKISTSSLNVTASDDAELTGITSVWLTNAAQPSLAVQVTPDGSSPDNLVFSPETRRETEAQSTSVQLDIEGSASVTTVVTGPRKDPTWLMEIIALTGDAMDALTAILANSAPISLRKPASLSYMRLTDGFYSVGDLTSTRAQVPWAGREEVDLLQLPLVPSVAPAFDALWEWNWDALAQTGMTWDQTAAVFPTWDDLLIGPTS